MNEQEMVNVYCEAKRAGMSMGRALMAVIKAGASADEAQDICWLVEKGRRAPAHGLYADTREVAALESQSLKAMEQH